MFKKIVTIGCSFTYGYGLENPQTQAWPFLISEKLNLPLENLAESGASNEHITNLITAYTAKNDCKDTLFIIGYTQWSRQTFFSSIKNKLVHMGPWWIDKFGNRFAQLLFTEYYNERYAYIKYLLQLKLLQSHLDNIGTNYIMFEALSSSKCPKNLIDDPEIKVLMNYVQDKIIGWQEDNIDLWLKGIKEYKFTDGHPNEKGHEIVANKILEIIANKYSHRD